jgi:tyrosyl-tRNA synthetase
MTDAKALLEDLGSRQLIVQHTAEDSLLSHLSESQRTIYCGFDPTADSLHIGHLVPLLALCRFKSHGHRAVALIGGATGLVGDPSFKAAERGVNDADIVAAWSQSIAHQIRTLLQKAGAGDVAIVNNMDWFADLRLLPFLRNVGKRFSVNSMIRKDSVKQRIEREGEGISFTEFTYMIMQAYDFAELNRRIGCTVQIGGSDQWGNITCGIELCRRQNQAEVHALTFPLVTKADGTKFGKTEGGTVWLDGAKTSPYAFYQFWINTSDEDVYRFLRYFTFLPVKEIAQIEREDKSRSGRPDAQRILAGEVTRFAHGKEGLKSAERITEALFTERVESLNESDFQQLVLDGLPSSMIEADTDKSLPSLLVEAGVAQSGKQVKDALSRGSISINGKVCTSESSLLAAEYFSKGQTLFGRYFLLRFGKKSHHIFLWPG